MLLDNSISILGGAFCQEENAAAQNTPKFRKGGIFLCAGRESDFGPPRRASRKEPPPLRWQAEGLHIGGYYGKMHKNMESRSSPQKKRRREVDLTMLKCFVSRATRRPQATGRQARRRLHSLKTPRTRLSQEQATNASALNGVVATESIAARLFS